ncbi:hypothetical protein ACIQ6V_15520 [Streptomyces sp. NPDC096198]|uniref:hypothetical protein n=1 Tax=Streptomyces sp. NPDC096198 TaxID=3366080 RepID=UPI0038249853
MSLTKDYIELEDSILHTAAGVAHLDDAVTRMRAITHLFDAIGEQVSRSRFHDKPKVAAVLVRRVSETYVSARREVIADMRAVA